MKARRALCENSTSTSSTIRSCEQKSYRLVMGWVMRSKLQKPVNIGATADHKVYRNRIATKSVFALPVMILKDNEETRREASRLIAAGGVVAFRTDTFYGLGVDPFNAAAIRKIREIKGREETKPILLLISDDSEVDRFIQQSAFFK